MAFPQYPYKPFNMPYGFASTGSLISDDENGDNDRNPPLPDGYKLTPQDVIRDENDDNDGNTPLPDGYKPAPEDVICARGKASWDHPGNQRYRELISAATPRYSETANKLEKTLIVSEIAQSIHESNGKFIKKLKKGGPFVIVSEVFAREKIGQSLRDGLSSKYKSATKFKKQKQPKTPEKMSFDLDQVVNANQYVSEQIQRLRDQVEDCGYDVASDAKIMTLFSRTNSDILEELKRDRNMMQQFEASVSGNKDHCSI